MRWDLYEMGMAENGRPGKGTAFALLGAGTSLYAVQVREWQVYLAASSL